ncbi:MAG: isoleucine--tRNA ligase [Elusimicrobiota bacterium]|nr:isoleucine--tRNA ligase [Elusimicrobiota bacterium]
MTNVDYSKTVNLPNTNFSMKANLVQKEPRFVKFWQENKIYEKLLEKNQKHKVFILHDGPPYANGKIHIGHALNKILKDIVVKYKLMNGYFSPFIPGWDCHGLPIEYQLFKELKISKEQIPQVEFRKKAKEYAQKYVEIQKEEFIRLGVFGDWNNPYLTMSPNYERNIINTFSSLVKEGYIVRRKKPVYWCIDCETSLAEAEVEYEEKTSDSIYVKFPVVKVKNDFNIYVPLDKLYILIWTTTPWTLPANLALAVKPDSKYVIVKYNDEYLILMENRLQHLKEIFKTDFQILQNFYGREIVSDIKEETTLCKHPFIERISYCLPYENVSEEEGTGVVHIAPGHGEEDYYLGVKYDLPIYSPVDAKGRFDDVDLKQIGPKIYGYNVFDANKIIIDYLNQKNLLLYADKVQHSYPHCWRCKNPVIFRATEQWFLSIDHKDLRNKLLEEIKKVTWVPEIGKNRISSMVSLRPDWCLSRQRYWGVPIPAVYCSSCGEVHLTEEILEIVENIFSKEGSDSWFIRDITDFLPAGFKCKKCGNNTFKKETDILDVWYDSAVSYKTLYTTHKFIDFINPENIMYLEGSDQHRGWFQVSLIVSTAVNTTAPYGIVLTHGFVVDGEGRKMSKSLGNVILPQEIIQHHGAEILRLWSASADYSLDVRISQEIINRLIETYRKIRNTIRYILGNLSDFDISNQSTEFDLLDRYILSRLNSIVEDVVVAYEEYKFYKVVNIVNNFFIKELSSFYFDILKDKLYTYKRTSQARIASQTVLYKIFEVLVPLLAPILSFTMEEAWQEARSQSLVSEESVFFVNLANIKQKIKDFKNLTLEKEMEQMILIRDSVNIKLEDLRKQNIIGSSLEAEVRIKVYDVNFWNIIQKFTHLLQQIFIVSKVNIELSEDKNKQVPFELEVQKFDGKKCPRCWVYFEQLSEYGICYKCKDALGL